MNLGSKNQRYFVEKQKISGVNFNTNRPLRKFLYEKLIITYKKILKMRFNDIASFLKTTESVNFFLRYGDKSLSIYNIKNCPNCLSKNNSTFS